MKSFTVQLGGKEFLIQQDDDGKFILPDELKAWRSHKTAALKPSWEPVLCFRAPDRGMTYAELAIQHGSGALNVDAGRIGLPSETFPHRREAKIFGTGSGGQDVEPNTLGRYPPNLAFECLCERTEIVDAPASGHFPEKRGDGGAIRWWRRLPKETGRPEEYVYGGKAIKHTNPDCPAYQLDAQAGDCKSSTFYNPHGDGSVSRENTVMDVPSKNVPGTMYGDAGGPSRFFYCAKASRGEREEGLDGFEEAMPVEVYGDGMSSPTRMAPGHTEGGRDARASQRVRNIHPTVKPIDLNRWLASLLLPAELGKPRRLLVPFSGSGSEIIGALLAGWDDVTGIEKDSHYCEIAQARIAYWGRMPVRVVDKSSGVETVKNPVQGGLF